MESNAETKSEARDDRLIVLLGEGRSYEAAAAIVGCSGRTIQRRMKEPGFAQAVFDQRRERVSAITGLIVGASERAVAVLSDALDSTEGNERLRAAGMLLDHGRRFHRDEADGELLRRLLALEAKIDQTVGDDSDGANPDEDGAGTPQ